MVGLFGFVGCSGVTMGSVVHYCLMAFQSVVKSSLLVLRLLSCQSNQHFGVYQKGESHVRLGFLFGQVHWFGWKESLLFVRLVLFAAFYMRGRECRSFHAL